MDIVYLLIGIAIGFALAWFIKKSQQQSSSAPAEELIQLRTQLGEESNLRSGLQSQNDYIKQESEKIFKTLLQKYTLKIMKKTLTMLEEYEKKSKK